LSPEPPPIELDTLSLHELFRSRGQHGRAGHGDVRARGVPSRARPAEPRRRRPRLSLARPDRAGRRPQPLVRSAPPTYRPGMRVEVLMFDGVADMDATLPHDVFCRARLLGADVESVLVTSDGASEVTGCYGTRYAGLVGWTPEHADVLVVAGGWIERDADGPLPGRIAEAKRRGGDGLVLAGSD